MLLCIVALLSAMIYFAYDPASNLYGSVYSHKQTKQKVIALTFDDGPNGQATLQVLDILKQNGVRATFFVVGDNVRYYPEIARQISAEGHEIENHSLHHQRYMTFRDEKKIQKELLAANQIIYEVTGQRPTFFRPPYGFRTPWAIKAARKAGFTIVTWNDLTSDYRRIRSGSIHSKIISQARPGAIINLHDGLATKHGANRDELLKALPIIIKSLKSQGYQLVTINQMISRQ